MDEIRSCELFLHVCRLNPYFEKDTNLPGGAYLIAAHHIGVDILYVLTGVNADLNLTHFPSN
ncbi:hypothetical protein XcvCFBP7113P_08205 [Xanthomonas citri pv. vignicola]|nr:hypothetical protein XcvCFBP7113P_08205 [Xanthomonas citri pv. vignicola]